MKLVIWGTGFIANQLLDEIDKANGIEKDSIIVYCDNNEAKQGTVFHGVRVVSPLELKNTEVDFLVIASSYLADIRKQIKDEALIAEDKIVELSTYKQLIYTRKQYFKQYGNKNEEEASNAVEKKAVIYTAITGEYDDLIEPAFTDANIRYICVTNNDNLKSDVWEILKIKDVSLSNVMLARRIKLLPWEYFESDNELNIWVDANLPIKGDLLEYAGMYMHDKGMLCFPHSDRCCICDEAAAVITHRPDVKKDVILQTAEYMKKGMPMDFGLYETGCMVRDFSNPKVKKLMLDWWNEIVKYTYRDQISLPYVCWKNKYLPDICDQSIWWNKWIGVNKHNK